MFDEEIKRLEKVADEVRYSKGFNGKLMYYRFLTLKDYFRGKVCLELGCADGLMTQLLVKKLF